MYPFFSRAGITGEAAPRKRRMPEVLQARRAYDREPMPTLTPTRHRLASLTAAFVLVTFAAGCGRSSSSAPSPSQAAPPAARAASIADHSAPGAAQGMEKGAPVGGGAAPGDTPIAAARALVVTIDLAVIAKNPDGLADRLRAEVERSGGFIADATSSGSGDGRTSHLVLRMPVTQARNLRSMLADYGKITNDTEKSEDVTEQRADLGARLDNARAQEKRLVEIMAHRTGGVSEVLEVERELARVRETIERFEAQKRTLDGKIDLATVTVAITTPAAAPPPVVEEGAFAQIKEAFHGGVHATGVLLLWAAMAFAATLPVLVPLALLLTGIFFFLRRRRALRTHA